LLKNNLLKNKFTIGVILLFIITSITPMVTGFDILDTERFSETDATLANLRHICTDENGFSEEKYEYYKQEYHNNYKKYNDLKQNGVEPIKDRTNFDLSMPLSKGVIDSSWPMKCHDTHHTGRSPVGTADIPYDELWRYDFDGSMQTSPMIDIDGIIYVGGSYGELTWYLFAIYPNGTLKWRYFTEGLIQHCCPAIAEDGTIFIGAWDQCLHAVNPDGTRKWKFDSGKDIVSSPAIGDDGTIYFGTMAGAGTIGKIYAINPNGTEKWQYSTNYHIISDPAIGDDGTIYIGSSDDYLYAMYPNGTLRWKYKTGDWVRSPVSIADDGTIYFSSWDYYLYALNPNGVLRWKTEIWYGSDTNPTIGTDGTIYISSSSKHFAINPENGDIVWEFNLGGKSGRSSPAICADGIIYIGIEIGTYDGGEIVAINSDGTEHWRQRISNWDADSSPAIGNDGTVYICSTSEWNSEDWGHLHAFGRGGLEADAHGPYIGIMNEPVQFTGSASGGYLPYNFHWDFGDEGTSDEQTPTHIYSEVGNYTITLTVTDDNDTVANDITWILIRESNDPPSIPDIDGETHGHIGESYDYLFISNDIDEDEIWYFIEWGDGTDSGWLGPYNSKQKITISHTWDEEDTYTIRAKAKDVFGLESDWAYLEVTMPVNQLPQFPFIQWLLEQFPNSFPILRQLLGS
jgi:outer membrane protein assembly factor BamB